MSSNLGETDYNIESSQLTFTLDSDVRLCTTLNALDDFILESTEVLHVYLSTNIINGTEPLNLALLDNDSKL